MAAHHAWRLIMVHVFATCIPHTFIKSLREALAMKWTGFQSSQNWFITFTNICTFDISVNFFPQYAKHLDEERGRRERHPRRRFIWVDIGVSRSRSNACDVFIIRHRRWLVRVAAEGSARLFHADAIYAKCNRALLVDSRVILQWRQKFQQKKKFFFKFRCTHSEKKIVKTKFLAIFTHPNNIITIY